MEIWMLNGKARCGKDTAAKILTEEFEFCSISFAAPIRSFIMEICQIQNLEELDKVKNSQIQILGNKTPRYAMQTLGTEWGRDLINNQLWTMRVANQIKKMNLMYPKMNRWVISDLRFDNEYYDIKEFFPDANIRVFEIIRPDNSDALTGSAAAHKSESGLSSEIFRETIVNDLTIEAYESKIRKSAATPRATTGAVS